jgi:hypothetical protein
MWKSWGVALASALLMRRDAQLDPRKPAHTPHPPRHPCGRGTGSMTSDQLTPNFINLIAAKSVTSPPTRLVA